MMAVTKSGYSLQFLLFGLIASAAVRVNGFETVAGRIY